MNLGKSGIAKIGENSVQKTVKSQSRSNSITMDSIIKAVNLAYDVLEKENSNKIDAALFAEEHIHSVIDLYSNKDLSEALELLVLSVYDNSFVASRVLLCNSNRELHR